MKILTHNKWKDGFLDYYQSPEEYRIKVLAWISLEKLENVYHIRPKSLRLLWNYFPVVGPGGMFRKIWSRLREEWRNEKYTSCGIGEVLEEDKSGKFKKGDRVGFMAPLHPALVERITVPEKLIFPLDGINVPFSSGSILYHDKKSVFGENSWWRAIRGWSIYSGIPISEELREKLSTGLKNEIANTNWNNAKKFIVENDTKVTETKGNYPSKSSKAKGAVLFGFGNYPKINNIPYSKPYIQIKTVHEIDPTEIAYEKGIERWDTSPMPRQDEKHDVYFVASYNHTHVPIALHALDQGAYVIMEKPIATDYQQLKDLEDSIKKNGEKIFIGFQKRYSKFNEYAKKDLGVMPGDPIDYHCVVFEIIQPEFFWYNWPNSLSRLFANGCHLVDHFLYLNEFSEPTNLKLEAVDDGIVNIWIELKNGAIFTMAFSEKGSSRVGPRDHIELKVPGRNVRITDAIRYFAEDDKKILRKKRVWKTEAYKRMYKTIAKKIANGERGDSLHSVMVSGKIMLDIEEKLKEALAKRGKTIFDLSGK